MSTVLEVDDLSVRYGSVQALDGISLGVERGSFVLVTGPSGCGKSTLALCLAGLIPHASGADMMGCVRVEGLDTRANPPASMASRVGLVFQNPATQLFNPTVEEEIAFAPRNVGLPGDTIAARVQSAAKAAGIAHLLGRAVRELSVGEQQLVAIASVLALGPQVLVLDEPTANLDWRGTERILSLLARLQREEGVTVIIIEHRLRAASALADRALLLREGRMVADGRPDQVLGDLCSLGELGMRCPGREAAADSVKPVGALAGPPSSDARPLVALQGVEAGYARRTVLRGFDLAIHPGEFVALVGDNGAGKSTVARLIAGMLRARRGRVTWNGGSRSLAGGRRVGLLFQNPLQQLVCDTVADEVAFGPGNYGTLDRQDLQGMLEAADLTDLHSRRPQALSAGEQQRTALAATMALNPRLLILDEPTMGQDWGHLSRLMDYLVQLNRDGQAILLITHDDRLVCRYADRAVVLQEGRVAYDGPPAALPGPDVSTAEGIHSRAGKGNHDRG